MKAIKVPQELTYAPHYLRDLKFNDVSVVESCMHTTTRKKGTMFLSDHMLLVVLEGTNVITHGKHQYTVNKNEMILLKKSIQFDFNKIGNPKKGDIYDSLMFFLKDDFLIEFMKLSKIESAATLEPAKVSVKPISTRLAGFCKSIVPFFEDAESIDAPLLRMKMLELLYDLANTDKHLLLQMLQLKQQVHADIPSIVEENYANPVSLSDLAYLSGRSLSTFKRDFFTIYQTTPAQWIRDKRLAKAKELLNFNMPVTDVCYSLGFENVAHFSRLFKSSFGYPPSSMRST